MSSRSSTPAPPPNVPPARSPRSASSDERRRELLVRDAGARGPASGMISTSWKPASRHQPASRRRCSRRRRRTRSACSATSSARTTFSRRASSMRFSITMNAPPGGQRVVGRADQVHLPLEVPVVQDHAHRDDVRLRERVARRSRRLRRVTRSASPAAAMCALRDRRDHRQVEARAAQVRVALRGDDRDSCPVAPPTSHSVW